MSQLISLRTLRETPTDRILKGNSLLDAVAVLVGDPEVALRLLHELPDARALASATAGQLQSVHGMTDRRTARLMAGFQQVPSLIAQSTRAHQTITSPADAARYLTGEMRLLDQEELWVLNLSTRNTVLSTSKVYRGSVNTSLIRSAEIFRDAIRLNAPAIIVAHNHPSSDPSPSQDDVTTTRSLIAAGQLLDIELIDHLIIGGQNFVSLKERGLAFDG